MLNRLVYQKGGWVLHMLRGIVGTEEFWTGIRDYYRRYRNLNASTDDFRQVMEQAAGNGAVVVLRPVAEAAAGCRRLKGSWRYDRVGEADTDRARAGPGRPAVSIAPRDRDRWSEGALPRIERIELSQAQRRSSRFRPTREPSSWCWTRTRGC